MSPKIYVPDSPMKGICCHRIVVDESGWRRCLTCGTAYNRSEIRGQLVSGIESRYPPIVSPWSTLWAGDSDDDSDDDDDDDCLDYL